MRTESKVSLKNVLAYLADRVAGHEEGASRALFNRNEMAFQMHLSKARSYRDVHTRLVDMATRENIKFKEIEPEPFFVPMPEPAPTPAPTPGTAPNRVPTCAPVDAPTLTP
jgi:hypothetical protein